MISEPDWFRAAIGTTPETGSLAVSGISIRYRAWGDASGAGVVLVHGAGAHSSWWDHVGPLLSTNHRVVAVDLSGHGDSERRPSYTYAAWADEVRAVSESALFSTAPTLVGHSMGGLVVAHAAGRSAQKVGGVIMLDTVMRERSADDRAAHMKRDIRPPRVYATSREAMRNFRLVPPQRHSLPYVVDHIARNSIAELGDGWTWKFDPRVFRTPYLDPADLPHLTCRLTLLKAEHGAISQGGVIAVHRRMNSSAIDIEIVDAGHHMMLDQPLALVAVLRLLLADTSPGNPNYE